VAEPGLERVAGRVERVIYANPATLWSAVALEASGRRLVAVGLLGSLKKGESLVLHGRFRRHPVHGQRLEVEHFQIVLPDSGEGIRAYLASGLLPGVGPALAERVMARFGQETLRILHEEPDRLLEVPGIGPKKLAALRRALEEKRGLEGLVLFLKSHDLPVSLAVRLFRSYGPRALAQVRDNPYLLAQEVSGLGFKRADQVALKLGLDRESPLRLEAGLSHVLNQAAEAGHLFLPYEELISRTAELLEIGQEGLRAGLADLVARGSLAVEDMNQDLNQFQANFKAVYLPPLYRAERGVALDLARLTASDQTLAAGGGVEVLAQVEGDLGLRLAPGQRQALEKCLTAKVLIITGGPGTGKTTIVRALVDLLERLGLSLALAAPTGRAAKRLAEATDRPAMTLHRLLEYGPSLGFKRHRGNRLDLEAVIVDEASMIDIGLMAHLLQALPNSTRLVLVGDADQLPPVGPGQVLADLIASDRVAVARLDTIFRQASQSRIVANAHLIRQGRMPHLNPAGDFYFINQPDPARALATILELVSRRIPGRFRLDPRRQIQVLAPMRRGVCGVEALNLSLQERLNPTGGPVGGGRFRLGDRVIQTRNNYDRLAFNGDIGFIEAESPPGKLQVNMEGELKTYALEELDELALAYCLSVHKAQGSEYEAVVAPLLAEHAIMLRRNLVYTALTRARRLVVLVGDRSILARAVRDDSRLKRHSLLERRLKEGWDEALLAGRGEG